VTLRIAVLQHEPENGLGAFAALLDQAPVEYEIVETLRGPLSDPDAFHGAIALGGSLNAYDRGSLRRAGGSATVYSAQGGEPGQAGHSGAVGRKTRARFDTNGRSTPVGRRRCDVKLSYVNKGFAATAVRAPVSAVRHRACIRAGRRLVVGSPT
jgi:hypothetical protein